MKRILFILIFGSWLLPLMMAQPSAGHYDGIDAQSGSSLFQAVSAAANQGYKKISYDGLYTAYKTTDMKDGRIWDMYSTCGFDTDDKCGSYKNECDCYNREHSIPQSWWGGGTSNQGSDIFHVIPTDGKVNGMRSNYPFGEVGSASYTSQNGCKVGTSSFSGYSGKVFEPIDTYKGDLARGVLGAMIKWKGSWTESNGSSTFNGNYTASSNFGLTTYAVNLFLKWHREDPVSQKELDRNNGIEKTQGNRNPFIDYPELVEYIWGNKKGETVSLSSLCLAYTSDCGSTGTPDNGGNENGGGDNSGNENNQPEIPTGDYAKVLTALTDYSGVYLIVNEATELMLDGSQSNALPSANTMSVTIANQTIASTAAIDAAAFTVAPMAGGYSICTQDGTYIGGTSKNTILTSASPILNTIAISGGNAVIKSEGRELRYNKSATMFRYYTSGQEAIQLYKKQVTIDGETTNIDNVQVVTYGNTLSCTTDMPLMLQVFDYTGRLILQANEITTFEQSLPSGFYLVRFGNTTTKIRIYE